jgi:hypothetical protein
MLVLSQPYPLFGLGEEIQQFLHFFTAKLMVKCGPIKGDE